MDTFIGRRQELEVLERAYRSASFEFVPVYGRRRVGKSELILHFAAGKPAVYFLGKTAPAGLQIREFLQEAARALQQPLLAEAAATDWRSALQLVLSQKPADQKLILALDEFQWTAKASPELPSVLQEFCDAGRRASRGIVLILCGSYLGFMEREVLGKASPLFGRRTAQILLRPFSYAEARGFHPRASLTEAASFYAIAGGIPFYLRFFSQDDSLAQNLQRNFLTEFAALYREADFLLREELKDVEKYHGILLAMAGGQGSPGPISRAAGVPERSLHYYLQQLVDLGYIERRRPLAPGHTAGRSVRFAIADPLLRFWFRFVYPHTSAIQSLGPERAYHNLIAPQLDAYLGHGFERLCRDALPHLYRVEGVNTTFEVGEYWDKHMQVDVVGVRGDRRIDLGECKWGRVSAPASVVRELDVRLRAFPNPENATVAGRVFCRLKPRTLPRELPFRWHALDDLYAAASDGR